MAKKRQLFWAVIEGSKTVWGLGRTKESALKDARKWGGGSLQQLRNNPDVRVSRCTKRLFDYVHENDGDLRRQGTVIQLANGFFDLKLFGRAKKRKAT